MKRSWSAGKKESLSKTQRQQIEQMSQQLKQIKPRLSEILEIAEDVKDKTIESILGKSDEALLQEILSGNIPPPG